jgi:ABC-type Fe3+-hydroxamate transport system substrate-binding protein
MLRLLCILILLFAAPALAHPVTVQSCNRQVTFDAPPKRAVSYDVNMTDTMLALELQDRMGSCPGAWCNWTVAKPLASAPLSRCSE